MLRTLRAPAGAGTPPIIGCPAAGASDPARPTGLGCPARPLEDSPPPTGSPDGATGCEACSPGTPSAQAAARQQPRPAWPPSASSRAEWQHPQRERPWRAGRPAPLVCGAPHPQARTAWWEWPDRHPCSASTIRASSDQKCRRPDRDVRKNTGLEYVPRVYPRRTCSDVWWRHQAGRNPRARHATEASGRAPVPSATLPATRTGRRVPSSAGRPAHSLAAACRPEVPRQPPHRLIQNRILLAEREPRVVPRRIPLIERRYRDRRHPRLLRDVPA